MDKVIIDGVDVSGCVRLAIDNISCDLGGECKGWDNCYYKQLQRAKAENKELERKYADVLKLAKENADSNEYCLQELEKENEQLKKSIDRIMQNKEIKTIDSEIALLNAELQQQNERLIARLRPLEDSYFKGLSSIGIAELAKKSIRITAENRKLEDVLQEIREIIDSRFKTSYMTLGFKEYDELIEDIDKIVNEVIGAEE